jgi:NAD(P)H-hydrate epimerase
LKLAKNLAKTEKFTLVVKGHPTHTITAGGRIIKNNTGGPALATAGTGDVLTGIIGGIIAQGIPPGEAVPAAVYLHGKAGDLAANLKTEPGVIASDIIELIPQAFKA